MRMQHDPGGIGLRCFPLCDPIFVRHRLPPLGNSVELHPNLIPIRLLLRSVPFLQDGPLVFGPGLQDDLLDPLQ